MRITFNLAFSVMTKVKQICFFCRLSCQKIRTQGLVPRKIVSVKPNFKQGFLV